jgi:hypothetical protein
MAHHGTTVVPRHHDRILRDVQAQFLDLRGADGYAKREAEIAALPSIEWKGKTLRTVRCNGTTGRGPHLCNLPLTMCWNLIDLKHYVCVYHTR